MQAFKIFSTSNSTALTQAIGKNLNLPVGKMQTSRFSDGEIHVAFQESIRGDSILLIAQINLPYKNIFELFIAIDAARRASAKEIVCVIPYLPHSRQERKDDERAAITARLIADFLEHSGTSRIITIDMHATSIEGFYKIPIDHLSMGAVFAKHIRKNFALNNLCLCSPDFGGLKRIKAYKNALGGHIAVINKERIKPNSIAKMEIIGPVNAKNVILIDDLIDTGNTLVKAAKLIKEKGAKKVTAYATHGVLSGKAINNINQSDIDEVFVSDTIPDIPISSKIKTISCAESIAESIKRLMQNKSIKQLKKF